MYNLAITVLSVVHAASDVCIKKHENRI